MKREIIYSDVSPTAAQEASASMSELQPFSSLTDLITPGSVPTKRWLTCEHNVTILNGTAEPFEPEGEHLGIWSLVQSDDARNITVPPLEITFSGLETSTALTLAFDAPTNTFCAELNLKYYRGSTLLFERDFFPNSPTYSCMGTVEFYNKIIVQFKKLNLPRRFLKLHTVLFGLIRQYGGDELKALRVFEKIDATSQTLPINSSDFTIQPDEDDELLYQKRQSIEIRFGGELVAQHYINKAQNYSFSNIDIIGVLDTMGDYLGGVYTGNISAGELISDIVGGVAEIEIENGLRDIPIHGWLPIKKRRDALAMVQFAIGAIIDTSRSDKIHVFSLTNTVPIGIPVPRTYHAPTTEFEFPYTGVELIEYRLQKNQEEKKLFEEETDGSRITVNFRNPVWAGRIINGTLIENHPNYVVFEGTQGQITSVMGREYGLLQVSVMKNNPLITTITEEKIYSVNNQYLVHQDNSSEILDRLYNYYLKPRTVSGSIVLDGEKPGDNIMLNLAHGQPRSGRLEQVELVPGATAIKAGIKFRAD